MQLTLFVFVALVAMAAAVGQYYVPRSYYIIDAEGHASPPVPLRRLRRSLNPYPYPYGSGSSANANANARADSWGGGDANANANANANARSSSGGWDLPAFGAYGASNPNVLSPGQSSRQYGAVVGGRSVTASSSAGLDSTGRGYYDNYSSVSN